MKPKDYEKKRKALKEEKREISKTDFESTKMRKAKINDIKRSFRSLKRSEKQIIQKEIDDVISGAIYEDEFKYLDKLGYFDD
jgi:hypothetical protein